MSEDAPIGSTLIELIKIKDVDLAGDALELSCVELPLVCYHVYHRNQGITLPSEGSVYRVRGKCFRYEASNLRDMTRLWDFTMREVIFVGTEDFVGRLVRRPGGRHQDPD